MLENFNQITTLLLNNLKPSKAQTIGLLTTLVNDDSLSATWHPLGFIHFKLFQRQNVALRLHIWSNRYRKMQEPEWLIHNHVFDLKSYIVCGSIQNSAYKFSKNQSEPSHCIYKVFYDGCEFQLHKSNEIVSYREIQSQAICAGEVYSVSRQSFHSSTVDANTLTCTLVATQTTKTKEEPKVLGEVEAAQTYCYQRLPCNPEELYILLTEVKATLERE